MKGDHRQACSYKSNTERSKGMLYKGSLIPSPRGVARVSYGRAAGVSFPRDSTQKVGTA